jgi:hypothetical protein
MPSAGAISTCEDQRWFVSPVAAAPVSKSNLREEHDWIEPPAAQLRLPLPFYTPYA